MNNLPVELFENIFHSLHYKDKIECLHVCRAWKHALESTNLCQVVHIKNSTQLGKIIQKLEHEPSYHWQVERLVVDAKYDGAIDLPHLSSLCTNIKQVMLHASISEIDESEVPLSALTVSKTIERIIESRSQMFTHRILSGGVCPVLTDLQVFSNNAEGASSIISLLGNTPMLKKLSLRNYTLTLMDLELLHENVPLLDSLFLHTASIDSEIIPTHVNPANSMRKLSLYAGYSVSSDEYIDILNYFTKKYSMITDMAYYLATATNTDPIDFENSVLDGLLPHIKQVAPFLKTLLLPDSRYLVYVFPILDENDCQLKELTFFNLVKEYHIVQITESDQAEFIQKLTLDFLMDNDYIDYLYPLVSLTELDLTYNQDEGEALFLNRLLESAGSNLVTLKLSFTDIAIITTSVLSCINLKTLVLKNATLPDRFDSFINLAFPYLRTLIIDRCKQNKPVFYLQDLDLFRLELKDYFPPENQHVYIATICNNEKRWYTPNGTSEYILDHDYKIDGSCAIRSLPYSMHQETAHTAFALNSLYSFSVLNYM